MSESDKFEQQLEKAYGYVLFLLNIRLRTEGELIEKLRTKKYSQEVIDQTLESLRGQHYLDDARFAEVYVQNLKQYKLYGFYKVKQKLFEKRLPKEIIEQAMEDGFSVADETAVAKRFLTKTEPLFMTKPESFSYEAKQKLAAKLQSRGFRSEVTSKLLFS